MQLPLLTSASVVLEINLMGISTSNDLFDPQTTGLHLKTSRLVKEPCHNMSSRLHPLPIKMTINQRGDHDPFTDLLFKCHSPRREIEV